MHDDFFAWVRLTLLIIIFLAFAFWCNHMEDSIMNQQIPEEPVQKQPVYIAQEQTTAIIPMNTEPATEPTIRKPLEEITPTTEAATEPPTEPETEPTYTAEELEILALIIYQEAGADWCNDLTRLMVGTVVMNRIADPRFPDTMYDVATEERAYGSLSRRIEIMAGSGVVASNALQLAETGVDALHFSAKKMIPGRMLYRNPRISMGGTTTVDEYALRVVDEEEALSIVKLIKQL